MTVARRPPDASPQDGEQRYALGVEYDGTGFSGWQVQKDGRSVQEVLEAAVACVADEAVGTICAGRTDAGVHALEQVVHFDTSAIRSERNWLLGINANLPEDVAVRWATQVDASFNARFSARERSYRYLILNRPTRSALQRHRVAWIHRPLDVAAMQEAARHLLGEHDFSAFRAAACQARSPVREVRALEVERCGELIRIRVRANAFLHHMVRNIAGTLIRVGRGDASPDWVAEVLEGRDRRLGGITAPAQGLYLEAVVYPGWELGAGSSELPAIP